MTQPNNRRILLIDDMPAIHEDFRKILAPAASSSALDEIESALFGAEPCPLSLDFELDSAYQGEEGLARVRQARERALPYALAFVDMRMPLGWDGVETIERLWQEDPLLQVVICTAYTDYAWQEVLVRLDVADRLLILKKPFDAIEVRQLASALTAKWMMTDRAARKMATLEAAVQARTAELRQANEALQAEIVERKELECQLVQSGKLASIGQLAAGVAHEINNPIGFVLSNFGALAGYHEALFAMLAAYEEAQPSISAPDAVARLEALRASLALELCREDLPQLMRETREGIVRVRQIVRDLLDFARVDTCQDWRSADLHEGVDLTLAIVAGELAPRADVIKEYGPIPKVECLPSQVNQVLMNLLINAAQAIGTERGWITIRTGVDDRHVWIEIGDTGSGIAEADLPRIFDPFFTTKPVGLGSGLGLSVSYGIVRKHGGRIEVHSEIGKGSRFRVILPVRQPARE